MNKRGPIVVIEDDADDQHLLEMVFSELNYPNELVFLANGEEALAYFDREDVVPFIIISDVNLPKTSGFELRNIVHSNERLSLKCIPYIFFTTAADRKAVTRAYSMSVQGFFIKPHNYDELRETIRSIIGYWQKCYSPTSVFGKPDR
jgi:CheY-like chemotaxis protein